MNACNDFERISAALASMERWMEENRKILKNDRALQSLLEAKRAYEYGFAYAHKMEPKYSRFFNRIDIGKGEYHRVGISES